ncbi:glycosyl hydrolase family 28-related protein [Roseovarius sp. 2305UL8-3]|uniref:glycosyl hydrolase family 28-related protein n=1 Tax=Roseovarius conchicola TaxID=3121636 RepID=UPI00352789A7
MNKAITDGIDFMPPAFANGLDVWSSGDGTPGSDTYESAPNAALVPADQDFGGALEILKTSATQRLRYMGETPILPGCYLQVTARIKAISGSLPTVRIAAWAGGAGGVALTGVPLNTSPVTLSSYGEVVEVSAIVGLGNRPGVDMAWGAQAIYGHFGLDLTGPNGGVVRIDDIEITDATSVFLRDMMDWVDVRDYGAVGDGTTDDHAAFEAADAAANGRQVLIPEGTYRLEESVTFQSRTRFQGTVTMPDDKILSLTKNFDLPSYIDAFESEELAFKKAYQSLLNNSGHESLDLGGRVIEVRGPIDMQAAVNNKTTFKQRRVIRNGQFSSVNGPNWDTEVHTSQGTYSPSNNKVLTNVSNVANIPVGSLIEGNGVGREVYVRDKNVGAQTVTLSAPLYDAAGTQTYTFRRFKYMLDFSGFDTISKFSMSNIEFQCSGDCSAILLPPTGTAFHLRDCFITRPKDRGISSHGEGDQGMKLDRCQFISNESPLLATQRQSIALNANGNDLKLRHNRVVHFRHFAVLGGSSTIIVGNHVFQGDSGPVGPRDAGFVLTRTNNRATITGNYICDCSVEWGNEHDATPDFSSEFSFSGLSITNNVFLSQSTAAWFNFIEVKPHGPGHFINGLTVTGNTFRLIDGNIDRIEGINTSFANMDFNRFRNITFAGNTFSNVNDHTSNPLVVNHEEGSPQQVWTVDFGPNLPFNGYAQTVEAVLPKGPIEDASNNTYWGAPYYVARQGPDQNRVLLNWERPVSGEVTMRVRMDDPV